eukprot:m.603204 g.603204  ORF g.603204 m.603204 type:complete len:164 (+) comp22452_c3_seq11:77-568(+)
MAKFRCLPSLALLLGCASAMGAPLEDEVSTEAPRFDLMIALNYANPLRSYSGSSDCKSSSSSSTWMGVNCSYVFFNFTTPDGDEIGHKISANEKLIVNIESKGCPREAKNYYGPMNGATCRDTRVPGGQYDINVFIVEHRDETRQNMFSGALKSVVNFISMRT